MKKTSIAVAAIFVGVLIYPALKNSITSGTRDVSEPKATPRATAARTLQNVTGPGPMGDPSILGIPREPEFAKTAFTVTEGAIRQSNSEDRAPENPDTHPSVIREKVFTFDTPLANLLAGIPDGEDLPQIQIPLFDGEAVDIQLTRHDKLDARNGSVVGVVLGTNRGTAILGYSDDAQSGTIRITDEEVYSIFYNGQNKHRLVEVDLKKMPPCAHETKAHHHDDE